MVNEQLRQRGIGDAAVLRAMTAVPISDRLAAAIDAWSRLLGWFAAAGGNPWLDFMNLMMDVFTYPSQMVQSSTLYSGGLN